MSLLVVIKGPVANAGSTPLLSKMIGTKVPIMEAIMITETSDMATVSPTLISKPKKYIPADINSAASTNPFNKLNETSLINLFHQEPLKLSLAKP